MNKIAYIFMYLNIRFRSFYSNQFLAACLLAAIFFGWLSDFWMRPSFFVSAEQSRIVINEVAWMGTKFSANQEWIELFNNSDTAVDLNGWKLSAADGQPDIALTGNIASQGYFLLERTTDDTITDIKADLIFVGSLSNTGEDLMLKDSAGVTVDRINAVSGWWGGDNSAKTSMERRDPASVSKEDNWASNDGSTTNGQDAGHNNILGTPGSENSIRTASSGSAGEESEAGADNNSANAADPASATSTSSGEASKQNHWGDVVINEIVTDPADGDTEWIEVLNTTMDDIDLSGWTITDGSGAKTILSVNLGSEGGGRFSVITGIKGSLNNEGDLVILKDKLGVAIDQVAYGSWNDGDKDNNAPAASDPASIIRKSDGYNTGNNANDFTVTYLPTKAAANKLQAQAQDGLSLDYDYDYNNSIVITEVFPDPAGDDSGQEFIELFNASDRSADLTGWWLANEAGKIYKWPASSTKPVIIGKSFLVLPRKISKLALDNSQDALKLYQPGRNKPLFSVNYSQASVGQSWNNLLYSNLSAQAQGWRWSSSVTPGEANRIISANHMPDVKFTVSGSLYAGQPLVFDSSDTLDEDGDKLDFFWDFGDRHTSLLSMPEHTFFQPGEYKIVLTVKDGKSEGKKEKTIKIAKCVNPSSCAITPNSLPDRQEKTLKIDLILNEIFPDPAGSDQGNEWIEIFNSGGTRVNIKNWRLGHKGRFYKFSQDNWINPFSYFLISNSLSKIDLRNTSDEVIFYDNEEEIMDSTVYAAAQEGASWARGQDGKWYWTAKLTPARPNQISPIKIADNGPVSRSSRAKAKTAIATASSTSLELARKMENGTQVKVRGRVAVEPGILGSQIFYIVGSPGIQVYNYQKDFPRLQIGDVVEVAGEISEINGEKRIKTKNKANIINIEHQTEPQPAVFAIEDINDDQIGTLVRVNGEITGKKGYSIYIDDGTDELEAYVKKSTDINLKRIQPGDQAEVIGIISSTKTGLRLLPRFENDIIVSDLTAAADTAPQVLGESAGVDEWTLPARDKKAELFKYLIVIAAVLLILLFWLWLKFRKK